MTSHPAYLVSEAARQRETLKYNPPNAATPRGLGPPPAPPLSTLDLAAAPDSGLAAFAQLGLYRLNGARSTISLFDRSYQHIAADAIRPSSSLPDVPGDHLMLSGTAVPRVSSVCEHVLADSGGSPTTGLPVSVIPDLHADPRFCHRKDTDWRFYSGVPIRSPAGINIGVYCVVDTEPRPDGLTGEEIRFMQDISPTVMSYLESRRSNKWCKREDRMTCGLGNFVEGKATLSPSSERLGGTSFIGAPEVEEGSLNKKLQALYIHDSEEHVDANDEVLEPLRPLSLDGHNGASTPLVGYESASPPNDHDTSHINATDSLQGDVEGVFSRAANIIRESVQVEGAVFLETRVHAFGGLVGDASEPGLPGGLDQSFHPEGPTCGVLGFSTSESSSINGDPPPSNLTSMPERFLQAMFQQYPRGHIINFEADGTLSDDPASEADYTPPASPQFQRTDIANGGDSMILGRANVTHSDQTIAASIIKIFPGARNVAIFPLWDHQRNQLFAGGFAWSKTPARIFAVENELNYLRVFGLATMAQLARFNTRAAVKTKTDILGSISHELRSPLHGVVGAVELLRDTALDGFQERILDAIETSGNTLLDTIDHLLDYSETKNFLKVSHPDQSDGMDSPRTRANSTESLTPSVPLPELPAQLDLLVEEVVESVKAGHSFQAMSNAQFTAWDSSLPNVSHPPHRPTVPWRPKSEYLPGEQWSSGSKSVQIFLDIDPSVNWSFKTHPGAFRRIVMNLFGNSLKFTTAGSITVSLHQDPPSPHETDSKVVLTVTDSGRGISESYLRHHLFTPFSKEDHFSAGTGLGLSLVRQMTCVLGGNINIASRIGRGTIAKVTLPLPHSEDADDVETAFREKVRTLAGRKVRLRGFEDQSPQLRRVESTCRGWLQMEVVSDDGDSGAGGDLPPPDFVICGEEVLSHVDAENPPGLAAICPHIIICENSVVARGLCKPVQTLSKKGFKVLSQPIGPRKLAHALLDSESRWRESRELSTESPGSERSCDDVAEPASPTYTADKMTPPNVTECLSDSKLESPGRAKLEPVIVETVLPVNGDLGSPDSPPQVQSLDAGIVLPMEPRLSRPIAPPVETRPSILIVDDNPINLKILAAYLIKLNHPYTAATNGLEALERYTQSPSQYSCMLTDISMPVMDGLESTRRVRSHERSRGMRPAVVIALTGLGGASIQRDAFASGVDLLLTRPLVLRGLVSALEATGLR